MKTGNVGQSTEPKMTESKMTRSPSTPALSRGRPPKNTKKTEAQQGKIPTLEPVPASQVTVLHTTSPTTTSSQTPQTVAFVVQTSSVLAPPASPPLLAKSTSLSDIAAAAGPTPTTATLTASFGPVLARTLEDQRQAKRLNSSLQKLNVQMTAMRQRLGPTSTALSAEDVAQISGFETQLSEYRDIFFNVSLALGKDILDINSHIVTLMSTQRSEEKAATQAIEQSQRSQRVQRWMGHKTTTESELQALQTTLGTASLAISNLQALIQPGVPYHKRLGSLSHLLGGGEPPDEG